MEKEGKETRGGVHWRGKRTWRKRETEGEARSMRDIMRRLEEGEGKRGKKDTSQAEYPFIIASLSSLSRPALYFHFLLCCLLHTTAWRSHTWIRRNDEKKSQDMIWKETERHTYVAELPSALDPRLREGIGMHSDGISGRDARHKSSPSSSFCNEATAGFFRYHSLHPVLGSPNLQRSRIEMRIVSFIPLIPSSDRKSGDIIYHQEYSHGPISRRAE